MVKEKTKKIRVDREDSADPDWMSPPVSRRGVERLLEWFEANRRDLPWRPRPGSSQRPDAWQIWVSELMLQQTRVDTVIDYFQPFIRMFPTPQALADAPLQTVLKAWEGLGYYARARNLHRAAQQICRELDGDIPRDADGLRHLPGIGPYTAAAIASLAFGADDAVLDGNVIRVLTRLAACPDDVGRGITKRRLQRLTEAMLPAGQAAVYNEAMMELGALICLPRSPRCVACPVRRWCKGRANPETWPVKAVKSPIPTVVVAAAVVRRGQRILIAQRHADQMLGGMWEFPGGKLEAGESLETCVARELLEETGITIRVGKKRQVVHHVYSHFRLEMHVFDARHVRGKLQAIDCADVRWVKPEAFKDYPMGKADLLVVRQLMSEGSNPKVESRRGVI